jgi:hypothetical protein
VVPSVVVVEAVKSSVVMDVLVEAGAVVVVLRVTVPLFTVAVPPPTTSVFVVVLY